MATFDQLERSSYDSVPTILYEFQLGAQQWLYANGERDVVLGGKRYLSCAISDSGINQSGDTDGDDMTITMPADAEFTKLFRGNPPSQFLRATIRNLNRGDTEAPIVWAGLVKNGKRVSDVEYSVICKVLTASLNRVGIRLAWGRGCPHALYDRRCKVMKSDYARVVQISAVNGTGFTAPVFSLGDGYLVGGFVEFTVIAGVIERQAIEAHVGTRVTLLGSTQGLTNGMFVTVYPGCDRVPSTCEQKFNNLSNYLGFDFMPDKSLFDGDPIF